MKRKKIYMNRFSKDFLAMELKAGYIKENSDKLEFIKINNFFSLKTLFKK